MQLELENRLNILGIKIEAILGIIKYSTKTKRDILSTPRHKLPLPPTPPPFFSFWFNIFIRQFVWHNFNVSASEYCFY